jgi:dsDNA-specific endonuclease/ATPase MutS2
MSVFPEGLFYFKFSDYVKGFWRGRVNFESQMRKWMRMDIKELERWKKGLEELYDKLAIGKDVFGHYANTYRPQLAYLDDSDEEFLENISVKVFAREKTAEDLLSNIDEVDVCINIAIESKKRGFNLVEEKEGGNKIKLNNIRNPLEEEGAFNLDLNLDGKNRVFLLREDDKDEIPLIEYIDLNFILGKNGFPVAIGKDSIMPKFRNKLVFVGGEENIQKGKSYFRDIAEKLRIIIDRADSNSFILINRLQGSDYWELSGFKLALIRYFNQMGATVIMSTNAMETLYIADDTISYRIISKKETKNPRVIEYGLEVQAARGAELGDKISHNATEINL